MTYSAKHKASGRYGVLTPNGEWLVDFLGTKQEAEAKANELNSVNDSDSSNTGIDSTGENAEQTGTVNSDSDKGLQQAIEDDTSARAPFVSEAQGFNETVKPESTEQEEVKTEKTSELQHTVRFVLTNKGWLAK